MRDRHLPGQLLAAVCAVLAVAVGPSACGSESPDCPAADSGISDDGSDDGGTGNVVIHGTFSNTSCPAVNPIGIGPNNGGVVELAATINGDDSEGGILTLEWSATSGSFSSPGSLETTFSCSKIGAVTVTFTVSVLGCSQQASGIIECTKAASQ
jgi:hypothetical protein